MEMFLKHVDRLVPPSPAPSLNKHNSLLERCIDLAEEGIRGGHQRTYANFEGLDGVVQEENVAEHLGVLPVACQFRRPDIVGSASRQPEACGHHGPTRVWNTTTNTHTGMSGSRHTINCINMKPYCLFVPYCETLSQWDRVILKDKVTTVLGKKRFLCEVRLSY